MKQFISEDLKEEFYITLYFNIKNGFEIAGLKRAYLDFNRTLKIPDGNSEKRKIIQNESQDFLKNDLINLINRKINSQDNFDKEHRNVCNRLIDFWNELSYGQAQKWVNMTLKYWLLFGENRINSIERNAMYFHIPIDSYVQKGMFSENNPRPWSKIDNYDEYFEYQLLHRDKNTKNPPIIDEFIFFNKYKTN